MNGLFSSSIQTTNEKDLEKEADFLQVQTPVENEGSGDAKQKQLDLCGIVRKRFPGWVSMGFKKRSRIWQVEYLGRENTAQKGSRVETNHVI